MFGILNLNKPKGVTSRDVVNVVQKLVRPIKVGHAGTLDPMATGVLVVCLGKATRLISKIQDRPKSYVAEFTLGQTSDTDDSTGKVTETDIAEPIDQHAIHDALEHFVGKIQQVPPAYSAVRVKGQRAYKMARDGQQVELQAKEVNVHSVNIVHYDWPKLVVDVRCGSGTYIRSIARDLGQALNTGGLMSALQRTQIGPFSVKQAIDPDSLTIDSIRESLFDPLQLFDQSVRYPCPDEDIPKLKNGNALLRRNQGHATRTGEEVAVTNFEGTRLIALAEAKPENRLQPRQVFLEG